MAYVAIAIRKLSTTEPSLAYLNFFSITITLASLFTIPFGWIMPNFKIYSYYAMIGLLGGSANLWLSSII